MDPTSVTGLYDDGYAADYDQRFLLDAWPRKGADFELAVVKDNIPDGGRWLDVGCGTGWFLSQLPHVERAGIDLSPAMVAQARTSNPDALFVEQRSFLDDEPEWHGGWDLVSCIWQPYNYVDTVGQVETLLDNMAAWTKPGGTVFVPVVDLEDIRPHADLPYDDEPDVWGGSITLTSITWTWIEPGTGKVHTHLVAPHVGHFVKVLSPHFRTIEVLRYPPTERGGVSRKAVLATGRRGPDDDGADAAVVWHSPPAHPDDLADRLAVADAAMRKHMAELAEAEAAEENERLWAEDQERWAENARAWEAAEEHTRSETARADAAQAEVTRLWAEVERLSHAAAAPPSRTQLSKVPTKKLVRATLGRLRPDRLARRVVRRRG